jgi:hypothetical protein
MVRVQEPTDIMGCEEESSIANNDGFSKILLAHLTELQQVETHI